MFTTSASNWLEETVEPTWIFTDIGGGLGGGRVVSGFLISQPWMVGRNVPQWGQVRGFLAVPRKPLGSGKGKGEGWGCGSSWGWLKVALYEKSRPGGEGGREEVHGGEQGGQGRMRVVPPVRTQIRYSVGVLCNPSLLVGKGEKAGEWVQGCVAGGGKGAK